MGSRWVSMILAVRRHRNTDVDGCGQRKLQARRERAPG